MKQNINRGPGRPAYQVKWPSCKFTMADLLDKNEVTQNTGKGKFCTKLTLVKALDRDNAKGNDSVIVKLVETREPNSKSGLGRKTFVYVRRSVLHTLKTAVKAPKVIKVPKAIKVPITIKTPASVKFMPVRTIMDVVNPTDIVSVPKAEVVT